MELIASDRDLEHSFNNDYSDQPTPAYSIPNLSDHIQKSFELPKQIVRTSLNGLLIQDKDDKTDALGDLSYATNNKPTDKELEDLLFASKICKHTKSNTIVLVKNKQLLASGTGQTSRVDALKQAIEKAKN